MGAMRPTSLLALLILAMLGWATPAAAQAYRVTVTGTPAIASGPAVAQVNGNATVTLTFDVLANGSPNTANASVHLPSVRITGPDGTVTATGPNAITLRLNPPLEDDSFQIPLTDIGNGYFLEMDIVTLPDLPTTLDAAVGSYPLCNFFCSNFLILQGGPTPSYLQLICQTVVVEAFDFQLACTPAVDSIVGSPVTLIESSLGVRNGSGLHIEATGGPPGEFGFVITSASGGAPTPVAHGILCLGWPWSRYTQQVALLHGLPRLDSHSRFDATGRLRNQVGTSTVGSGFDVPLELPLSPLGQVITPGDTCYFQVCYRDRNSLGVPTINFSDRLEITFP